MVREIMRDVFFLAQKSESATKADLQVARDLLDTLEAHEIIVVNMGTVNVAMLNPVILKKSGSFETEEGCLSLTGTRKTKRFREIELEYQDLDMKKHVQKFTGWTAQIIQHECDHLEGIII